MADVLAVGEIHFPQAVVPPVGAAYFCGLAKQLPVALFRGDGPLVGQSVNAVFVVQFEFPG